MPALLLVGSMLAVTNTVSAQPLEPNADRDQAFHSTIRQFLDNKLTTAQLEVQLRERLRQFEAKPYRVSVAPIERSAIDQERLVAIASVLGALARPTIAAWTKGELTVVQAAVKIAPLFLVWAGYGLEPANGAILLFSERPADELLEEIGKFAAP
jgi:hypothetical protein